MGLTNAIKNQKRPCEVYREKAVNDVRSKLIIWRNMKTTKIKRKFYTVAKQEIVEPTKV